MGKQDIHEIRNLADLKRKRVELKLALEGYQGTFKSDIKAFIHQHTPGYMVKKYTRKPTEKINSVFSKVKSWFSKKKTD